MGVMRDMPLQKYVNDARVCLHSGDGVTDAKLRIAMRVEIRKLQRRLKTTSIYVTHDQLEAMTLVDIATTLQHRSVQRHGIQGRL